MLLPLLPWLWRLRQLLLPVAWSCQLSHSMAACIMAAAVARALLNMAL